MKPGGLFKAGNRRNEQASWVNANTEGIFASVWRRIISRKWWLWTECENTDANTLLMSTVVTLSRRLVFLSLFFPPLRTTLAFSETERDRKKTAHYWSSWGYAAIKKKKSGVPVNFWHKVLKHQKWQVFCLFPFGSQHLEESTLSYIIGAQRHKSPRTLCFNFHKRFVCSGSTDCTVQP